MTPRLDLRRWDQSDVVHGVILKGAGGKAFCSGRAAKKQLLSATLRCVSRGVLPSVRSTDTGGSWCLPALSAVAT